ncbi:unnamed protein product [Auanema sp. JU1783]|nr:unnamed protein product [Auanema sp. JU1783]
MARTVDIEHISHPRRPGICRVLRRAGYWKCLSCTILIIGCIFYASWCQVKHLAYSGIQPLLIYHHGPCAQGYNFVPIVFGLMLYIVYLMECWNSRTRLAVMKKVRVGDAHISLQQMRDSLPIVWWKSVCYHYVRRTRQITRYRNGDAVPATQVYYERVNSHTAGNVFLYDICGVKDISKNVMDLEKFPLTRIRVTRGFVFACMQAANEFEEQRARFFNENEIRDDYMEVREGMDLSELQFNDELLCFNSKSPPWFLNPFLFWFSSIFLLSWPLRLFAECRTAVLNYQVTKLFGTNYLSPSSINYTGPLTRTSTMETAELEAALRREQFFVVPSYSEAMLLHPQNALNAATEARIFSRPIVTSNENVILPNYGALEDDLGQLPVFSRTHRVLSTSRSMNLDENELPGQTNFNRAVPARTRYAPPRSLSISGITSTGGAGWSNGYQIIGETEDQTPLVANDDPPPPYEIALRMCAPIYERLRRSISSRLNSISHSSSKELKSSTNNNNNNNNGN